MIYKTHEEVRLIFRLSFTVFCFNKYEIVSILHDTRMASNDVSHVGINIEKLKGRQNYSDWKFQMTALLKLDGLWGYVTGQVVEPDQTVKTRQEEKTLSKLILSLDKSTFPHVMQATTAREAWTALEKAFEDKGLHRRLKLLRSLCSAKLSNYKNMEDYVNDIMAMSQQLISIGKPLDDEFLGAIMLQGLTEEYEPMVMALESSGVDITADFIKTKLLQDKKWQNGKHSDESALAAKHKYKKSPWCYICKQKGHYTNQCKQEKKEKPSNNKPSKPHGGNHSGKALFAALSVNAPNVGWYIDSGATSHMTGDSKLLLKMSEEATGSEIVVANNSKLKVTGTGTSVVQLKPGGETKTISDIKYVPNLSVNLLSVKSLVSKGYCVYFSTNGCQIIDQEKSHIKGEPVATASLHEGLYKLDIFEEQANLVKSGSVDRQLLWHRRLGHLNYYSMNLLKNELATGMAYHENKELKPCISCIKGKQARQPFPYNKTKELAKNKLDLIHSDLAGPMEMESYGGKKYLFTLIDDCTRKVFGYFLKSKDEVPDIFAEFCIMVQNQADRKIKVLRSDNGGEYCNDRFKKILRDYGIRHELTVPYSPQQNGVAERYNRTIIEKARSMLADSEHEKAMWAEAVNTAIYLINRSPAKKIKGSTPEEKWTQSKIDLSHLRIFGCKAYAHVPDVKRRKFDDKSKEYIFVGYSESSTGYRLLDPQTHHLKISRDVVFIEDDPPETSDDALSSDIQTSDEDLGRPTSTTPMEYFHETGDGEQPTDEPEAVPEGTAENDPDVLNSSVSEGDLEAVNVQEEIVSEPRYPSRVTKKPQHFDDFIMDISDGESNFAMLTLDFDLEPSTVSQALSGPRNVEWQQAINRELNAFKINNAWELVEKPPNANIVKNKWVFKIKRDQNGDIAQYRARLVAKGFTQRYGVDYCETFSPVIRFANLRLLLAVTAELNLEADHLDVETAFLNGDIDEEIYMAQPEGFVKPGCENKVCLLRKAIYGLKQSSRLWYEKAHTVLCKLNFQQSKIEPCIFFRNSDKSVIMVALYVDDFFVFYNNFDEARLLKDELSRHFHVKDLGQISHILGMKVQRNRENGELRLSQDQYIQKILDKFQMSDCKTVGTPLEQNCNNFAGGELYDVPFQQLIGSIMYLSVCTRPDITFAVSYLSQFNICHTKDHWMAAKRVLKYLKGTKSIGILYRKSNKPLQSFVDSDFANNVQDRKSFYGYVFTVAGGPLSWECQKQRTVALSSTEAEYIGICEAAKESLYLRSLCCEIFGRVSACKFLKLDKPIIIFNDNQSALKLSESQVFHKRTKHIHVKYHFIRDKVQSNEIELKYMSTTDMVADMLTKPLGCTKHKFICDKLNLV